MDFRKKHVDFQKLNIELFNTVFVSFEYDLSINYSDVNINLFPGIENLKADITSLNRMLEYENCLVEAILYLSSPEELRSNMNLTDYSVLDSEKQKSETEDCIEVYINFNLLFINFVLTGNSDFKNKKLIPNFVKRFTNKDLSQMMKSVTKLRTLNPLFAYLATKVDWKNLDKIIKQRFLLGISGHRYLKYSFIKIQEFGVEKIDPEFKDTVNRITKLNEKIPMLQLHSDMKNSNLSTLGSLNKYFLSSIIHLKVMTQDDLVSKFPRAYNIEKNLLGLEDFKTLDLAVEDLIDEIIESSIRELLMF